jgi:hypothetical protein
MFGVRLMQTVHFAGAMLFTLDFPASENRLNAFWPHVSGVRLAGASAPRH